MTEKRDLIVKLTSELVSIPSESKNQKEVLAALDLVSSYLDGLGLKVVDFEKNGVFSRLWINETNEGGPVRILLSGHIDVVDADEDQFVSRLEDGKIFGRGSGDMKGHDVAMMVSLRSYIEKGGDGSVGLLLTGDEEVGGFNGARFVLEQGLRAELVFVPDGTYDFDIVESQKAPHHFHVRASGVGGHASRAFEIENPVNRLLNVYSEMRKKYSVATKDNDWHSTFELTVIKTGANSENSIPSDVDAWFSWRWPLEDFSFEEGIADFTKLCEDNECTIVTETNKREGEKISHGMGEGCLTDRDDDQVVLWKKTIEEVLKKEVGFLNMHGATDGRHFYKYGSKVLATSAVSGSHHAKNGEWVDVESLEILSIAIEKYLELVA